MERSLGFDDNAKKILEKRFLLRNKEGKIIETPEGMFQRVAEAVAKSEPEEKRKEYIHDFYEMMAHLDFLPGGRILANAGTDNNLNANCFVLPIEDSIEGIYDTLGKAAILHKYGAGIGYDFSSLRPKNCPTGFARGEASGPVSFLRVYDSSSNIIKQGGARRSASMAVLWVDHPDILEFIKCKDIDGEISNFNISVGITDEFMNAVIKNSDFELKHKKGKPIKIKANKIWDALIHQMHKNGEPGVIFFDTINRNNPVRKIKGDIRAVNVCSEITIYPYEACVLGSINMVNMLEKDESGDFYLNNDKFIQTIKTAVRFLDDCIDMSNFVLPEIKNTVSEFRRIGLGITNWANYLALRKIKYDSKEALAEIDKVGEIFKTVSKIASQELAQERGAYPLWAELLEGVPIRNVARTTMAPTGTISLLIPHCTSGIEPIFAYNYTQSTHDKEKLIQNVMPGVDIKYLPTAHDVSPEWHIKVQSQWQKYIDNSLSKTINSPKNTTEKQVEDILIQAWKSGCKGFTFYRDGSRENQPLQKVGEKSSHKEELLPRVYRSNVLEGSTEKVNTGKFKVYVTVNKNKDGRPIEVFINAGKSGSELTAFTEALGRLISSQLQHGIPLKMVIKSLKGISGEGFFYNGKFRKSIPDLVAGILAQFAESSAGDHEGNEYLVVSNKICPECEEEAVEKVEGCIKCTKCGWSKC